MTLLHAFTWILLLLVPIVTVWRWNIVGVLLGTIADEMIFVISDLITFRLRSQEVISNEDWEAWYVYIWVTFFYCCFVLLIKFFIIVLLPPE